MDVRREFFVCLDGSFCQRLRREMSMATGGDVPISPGISICGGKRLVKRNPVCFLASGHLVGKKFSREC